MIKELLGKNKEKEEETYVYSEEGVRKEIMEISKKYVDVWKENSFQKNERIDFSFWHGENGLMKAMIEKKQGIQKY